MNNIEKISSIDKEQLSGEFYFQSLIQEAIKNKALGKTDFESIQIQCLQLLAYKTEIYNQGDSSSIRIEKAQAIMTSNLYTLGIYLKSVLDIDSALSTLVTVPIMEMYLKGRKMINTKLRSANHIYGLVCHNKIQTVNYDYNATIDGGMKGFFRTYDADFSAHEILPTLDYPLSIPVSDLVGIEYIQHYLQNLYLENMFCALFDAIAINKVLYSYDANYKELLINIFNQVLNNVLGCQLLKKDILKLQISELDIGELIKLFEDKTKDDIYQILVQAANAMIKQLCISNDMMQEYIIKSLLEISSKIYHAVKNNTLEKVIVVDKLQTSVEILQYSLGEKMCDDLYRNLIDELIQCRYSKDKIILIKNNVKSLADMEDVLLDADLNDDEVFEVLKLLGEADIAALIKRYSYCEENQAVDYTENEMRVEQYLEDYLFSLPPETQTRLYDLAENINCDLI